MHFKDIRQCLTKKKKEEEEGKRWISLNEEH